MSTPPTTRIFAVAVAIAVVVALLAGGTACGIATDKEPRAIASSSTSADPDSPSTIDSESANSIEETVYLIEASANGNGDGERLTRRVVHVPSTADNAALARSTLQKLIALQSDASGATNAIPSGTKILSTSLSDDGSELTIDLSEEFNDVQQALQRRAFAQLVFSATGLNPAKIDRVRFLIEGEPTRAATDNEGTPAAGDAVSRSDYPSFESTMASSTTELGAN